LWHSLFELEAFRDLEPGHPAPGASLTAHPASALSAGATAALLL
jgi:hypothetical protein